VVNITPGSVAGGYGLPDPQIPALPQYGLRITDTTATGEKMKIVVIGGTHAREQSASHMLDGFLRKLVDGSPEMTRLLARAEFFVYPQVNPEGRYAYNLPGNPHGIERDAPSNLGAGEFDEDLNRVWQDPAGWPQIVAIQAVIKADTGSQADLFLDFHARSYTSAQLAARTPPESPKQVWVQPDLVGSPFLQKLVARDPDIEVHPGSETTGTQMTGAQWARSAIGLQAPQSYTPECARDEAPAFYQPLGATYALALYDLLCAVPDRSGVSLRLDFNDTDTPGGDWVTLETLNTDLALVFPGGGMTGPFTVRMEGAWNNSSSTTGQASASLADPALAAGAADYLYIGGEDLDGTVTFSGLDPDLSYRIDVVASRSTAGSVPKTGEYTVNGTYADGDGNSNDDNGNGFDVVVDGYGEGDVLRWNAVRPDAQGRIVFRALSNAGSGSAGSNVYLNAMRITEVLNFAQFIEAYPELTGEDAEADGNPDGDDWSNEEEMILGTDPTEVQSAFTFELIDGNLHLSHTRNGRWYHLDATGDLKDPEGWSALGSPLSGTGGTLQVPVPDQNRFYRCIIDLQP
jgi:hypothetical protein